MLVVSGLPLPRNSVTRSLRFEWGAIHLREAWFVL